jgi:apolipoprotein N-acyltransferase
VRASLLKSKWVLYARAEVLRIIVCRFLFPFFGAGLSGVLLFLAFPVYDCGWLGWVALMPLLYAISGRSSWFGFSAAYLCGIVFFVGIFGWILDAPGYKIHHHALLALYLGSYIGAFGLALNHVSLRLGESLAYLAAPFIWVSLEYIRGNLSFLALPWPLMAYSQYQNPLIIQSASFSGPYGVSFMVVAVNATFATVISPFFKGLRRQGVPRYSYYRALPTVLTVFGTVGLSCMALAYGKATLEKPIAGNETKISVVQGNIERDRKWDLNYAKWILQTYTDMSIEASKDRPQLIVWPEAATPRSISVDFQMHNQIKDVAVRTGSFLLLGSTHHDKLSTKSSGTIKYANSAFLISPDRKVKNQKYDKIRLLPFGEYLPMKDKIPWTYIGIPDTGSYIPGKTSTVLDGPGFHFGVAICWESIFPDLIRECVKNGAQVLINLTNEGWFGETAPYQFLAWNVFRAVENRTYFVRCANTGISCFIDPYGRIVDRVKDKEGRDILIRGTLTRAVVPLESKTFYTRFGDWIVWLSLAVSGVLLLMAFLRKKPEQV